MTLSYDGTDYLGWQVQPQGATIQSRLQEALTNTLRHAEAQRAHVRLTYLADAIEIEVLDDGRGAPAGGGVGQGQLGMRERVALLGGELDLGPREEGGYVVRARIPLERDRP